MRIDIKEKDINGNIIRDSKQERIDREKSFSAMASKHAATDSTAKGVLDSFDNSFKNPENALIYLFEIIDALKTKLGGETSAINTLGISSTRWKKLGKLANNAPLLEGRHRGQKHGQLRHATTEELQEARSIATEMIEGYFCHLERSASL